MKLVKSLMLSSAAGIVAMSGAQAADLPIKAKAVEYVRICSLYGAGFYYIPGTDTCLKIGGYLRADIVLNSNNDSVGNTALPSSAFNRMTNAFTWRGRQDLDVDTRTATEYGVVRTFASMTFTWTSDSYAITPSGSTVYSPVGPSPFGSAPNNANGGAVAGGTLGVYYAFIQFAGFTIGKAISQFSAPWTNYPGNNFDGLVGGGGDVTGVNQVSYTWDFGQGVSAAISAQDPTAYYQAGNANLGTVAVNGTGGQVITQNNGPFGASATANTVAPDIVGMARWDSTWGMIQFSAAAHDNHAAYFQSALLAPVPIGGATISGTELAGHPEDKWGWAAQLALSWKNIPTGAGDTINVQGVYTDGATRYNIQDLAGAAGANQIYGGTSLLGAYQSVGLGIAPDTVFHNGGEQQLIKTWGMRGAFNHNWDPYWSSSLYGAYAAVSYNDTSKLDICGVGGVTGGVVRAALAPAGSGAFIVSCNPDYNIGQIGFITRWTPVKNLTFSADVTYTMLDQKSVGTIVLPASTVGKPSALYELKDENTWTALLRAQRNF